MLFRSEAAFRAVHQGGDIPQLEIVVVVYVIDLHVHRLPAEGDGLVREHHPLCRGRALQEAAAGSVGGGSIAQVRGTKSANPLISW